MPDIGDFIRRSRRSAKIAIAAPGTPGDFRRSRRSAYKTARCVAGLREKLKNLRNTVKRMLRNSCNEFLGSAEFDLNTNTKSFLSILKLNFKSHTIPDRVSTPISASASADPGNRTPLRSSGENPREIANLSNSYFASVFVHEPPLPPSFGSAANAPASPDMSELTLTVSKVQSALEALDVTKATAPDKIPAKLLKETASVIAPSLCKQFNNSLSTGSFQQNWKEANVVPVFKKGKAECTENYRPISLPSLVSKVLKRRVFNTSKIGCTRW